jgi:hypothetical protein
MTAAATLADGHRRVISIAVQVTFEIPDNAGLTSGRRRGRNPCHITQDPLEPDIHDI